MTSPPATILIVDDEIQNRRLLEALLKPEGYLTLSAASGEEALASIAQHAPDLILLDIMMPGMDGCQVASMLKAKSGTANIPIIMLTAQIDRGARLAGLNAGAEDFLTKPVERAELWLRVRNLLRMKALGDLLQNQSSILEQQVLALGKSEAKFRGMVNQSLVGIAFIDDGKYTYTNAKFNEIFGYGADEILALGPFDTAIESDRPLIAENIRKLLSGEAQRVDYVSRGLRKDGAQVDIECQGSGMSIDGKLLFISLTMDITERTRAEHEVRALQEKLSEQSTHDPLTGLYNRRYLDETFGRELILAQREGHPVSVIMGDLDHFKAINDRFGHLAGDAVLRAFGALMQQQARGSDIYCRYGGEEFLLVLPGMAEEFAVERAERLRSAMAAVPVICGASPIAVTASFGVATFPRDGQTSDELIAAADSALYAAKEAGRNRVSIAAGPASSNAGVDPRIQRRPDGNHPLRITPS